MTEIDPSHTGNDTAGFRDIVCVVFLNHLVCSIYFLGKQIGSRGRNFLSLSLSPSLLLSTPEFLKDLIRGQPVHHRGRFAENTKAPSLSTPETTALHTQRNGARPNLRLKGYGGVYLGSQLLLCWQCFQKLPLFGGFAARRAAVSGGWRLLGPAVAVWTCAQLLGEFK